MFVSFELESRKICSLFSFRYWFQLISFSSRTCKPEPESVITFIVRQSILLHRHDWYHLSHAACYGFMCQLLRFRRVVGNLCLPRDIGHSLSLKNCCFLPLVKSHKTFLFPTWEGRFVAIYCISNTSSESSFDGYAHSIYSWYSKSDDCGYSLDTIKFKSGRELLFEYLLSWNPNLGMIQSFYVAARQGDHCVPYAV